MWLGRKEQFAAGLMGSKYIDNFWVGQLRLERSQWALHVDELSGLLDHPNPINSGFKIYLFFFITIL